MMQMTANYVAKDGRNLKKRADPFTTQLKKPLSNAFTHMQKARVKLCQKGQGRDNFEAENQFDSSHTHHF